MRGPGSQAQPNPEEYEDIEAQHSIYGVRKPEYSAKHREMEIWVHEKLVKPWVI